MKLTISAQADKDIAPLQEVYTYRWNRIIIAVAGVLLAIGLIVATVLRFNSSEPQDATPVSPDTMATAPAQPQPDTVAPPAVPDARDFELQPPALPDTEPGGTARTAAPEESGPAAATPDIRPSTASGQQPAGAPDLADDREIEASTPRTTPHPQTAADTAPDSFFQSPSTTVLSTKIARFTLAASVQDKEPVGTLEDIKPDRNDVARVYVFSEATRMKDHTLHYIWSLDGRKVADVKVPVWSDRWRSYSSKLITPRMKGNWKVELIDESGQLLANSEFRY